MLCARMTIVWIVAGVLAGLVLFLFVAGSLIARDHVAAVRARLRAPPQAVWDAIADYERQPQWRSDLVRVERGTDAQGHDTWREVQRRGGTMTLAAESAEPPRKLVRRIADEKLPFGGTWTWVIEPQGAGATITITEEGFIRPPPFRFLAKYVFGYHATMTRYLQDLGRKFGQEVVVERVA